MKYLHTLNAKIEGRLQTEADPSMPQTTSEIFRLEALAGFSGMTYASCHRAEVPLLARATSTMSSIFLTLVGCLIAIAFLLAPWVAIMADGVAIRMGRWRCAWDPFARDNAPPGHVLRWHYECEKQLPNGNLRYSMSCTSSSSNGQLFAGNCSFSGLATSVSDEEKVALMVCHKWDWDFHNSSRTRIQRRSKKQHTRSHRIPCSRISAAEGSPAASGTDPRCLKPKRQKLIEDVLPETIRPSRPHIHPLNHTNLLDLVLARKP